MRRCCGPGACLACVCGCLLAARLVCRRDDQCSRRQNHASPPPTPRSEPGRTSAWLAAMPSHPILEQWILSAGIISDRMWSRTVALTARGTGSSERPPQPPPPRKQPAKGKHKINAVLSASSWRKYHVISTERCRRPNSNLSAPFSGVIN